MKPRIICLEGPNGAGKSTVAAELARLLSPSALFVYPSERPPSMAGWGVGERIAWYLSDMDANTHGERMAIGAGMNVIRDRSVLSTIVYQAGDDSIMAARALRASAHVIIPADITLVLRLPDEERERRLLASPRGARAELGGAEERARIARLYEHHADTFPGAVVVDASGSVADVVARCLAVPGVRP